MNFARIIDSTAVDVSSDPTKEFHPDIATQFVAVPDEVCPGWVRDSQGTWLTPSIPEASVAHYPKVGPIAFKLLFTAPERIKADELKATDPYIKDFWALLDDPRTDVVDMSLASVQMAIRHTLDEVKAAGIPVDVDVRVAQILTGVPQ